MRAVGLRSVRLGRYLSGLRKATGMSLRLASSHTGRSFGQLAGVEQGKRPLDFEFGYQLASLYGKRIEAFLEVASLEEFEQQKPVLEDLDQLLEDAKELIDSGHHAKAWAYTERAFEVFHASVHENPQYLRRILLFRANCHSRLGKPNLAQDDLVQARLLGELPRKQQIRHLLLKAVLERGQGDAVSALALATEARRLAKPTDDPELLGKAIMSTATAHFDLGDFDKSRELAREAQPWLKEAGMLRNVRRARIVEASCYVERGQTIRGRQLLNSVLAEPDLDRRSKGLILLWLGYAFYMDQKLCSSS